MRRWRIWLALALIAGPLQPRLSPGQPKAEVRQTPAADPEAAARRGKELVAELLSQKPAESSRGAGSLSIRNARGETTVLRIEFSIQPGDADVITRYSALSSNGVPIETLIICQRAGQPNEYSLITGTNAAPRRLGGDEAMRAFAGSDFWAADLGLDFLHWPGQAVTGARMRRGQACEILESAPLTAPAGGYSKIVSAIASQKPGVVIVYADAFDERGRLLKQFEPDKIERVAGQWQLQSMTMRNRQSGSRSTIEFDLGGGGGE
jgi:hypothetical protein